MESTAWDKWLVRRKKVFKNLEHGFDYKGHLSVISASRCVAGDFGGVGLLAMPYVVSKAGWTAVLLIPLMGLLSSHGACKLKTCCDILEERSPELRDKLWHGPYLYIAQNSWGRVFRDVLAVFQGCSVVGTYAIGIVAVAETLGAASVSLPFYQRLIVAACSFVLLTFFGNPWKYWFRANIRQYFWVVLYIVLLVGCAYAIAERRASIPDVWSATMLHSTPALGDVFSTFGVLMFAFRCEVVGTQVHKEMKYPRHFNRAVYIGITVKALLCLLLGGVGCAAFGTVVRSNVILSLTASDVRTVEAILALGLLTSDADVSYVLEEWEPLEEVDKKCVWKKMRVRVGLIAVALCLASLVSYMGHLLSVFGALFVGPTTFFLPCIFYGRLCSQNGNDEGLSQR